MLRFKALLLLILAGESIFFLPFVLPRLFRSTILDVFEITNLELGLAYSLYGIVAMFAYVLGGPLADYFSPRKLLAIALITTSLGGLFLWQIPSLANLKILYAYWGFTTIALFWSALIRTTRELGGKVSQGSAFGLLDGGRGLLTALVGTALVAIYASMLPEAIETASLAQRSDAIKQVMLLLTGATFTVAVLVWLLLPHRKTERAIGEDVSQSGVSLSGIVKIAQMPLVWLQAFIILCAYAGFKTTDYFAMYAKEVLLLDEVAAAKVGTISLWIRPIAAIGAGFLADCFGPRKMTVVSFLLVLIGSSILATGTIVEPMYMAYVGTIICASLGMFALRGLYFAIMDEGQVPIAYTGSAVGLISVVGYTPDIFMGPLIGYFLDTLPGIEGFSRVFLIVSLFSAAGLLATLLFIKLASRSKNTEPNEANNANSQTSIGNGHESCSN